MSNISAVMVTAAFADTMSAAGYEISDQLFNALEEEFAAALKVDKEEGNFNSLETLLGAFGYSADRTQRDLNDQ